MPELEARIRDLEQRLETALGRMADVEDENAALRRENADLRERLGEAEREAKRQAGPFRRDEEKKVPEAERKRPGRRPGHPGAHRAVPDHVDETIHVPLAGCPSCGGEVERIRDVVQYVEELPQFRVHVTQLITQAGRCPCCGPVRITHPDVQVSTAVGAAGVHLGARTLAWAAWPDKSLGLTMRRTCTLLRHLGPSLTPGGLSQALDRVADKVQPAYRKLVTDVRRSRAVFADETSWWVGGPNWWLWTFTTPRTTVYHVDRNRNSAVVRALLGDAFKGVLVSDCPDVYDAFEGRRHTCIAHHCKAISEARRRRDTPDPTYLDAWKLLFTAVRALWRARPEMDEVEFAERRLHVAAWCGRLLHRPVTQPGDVAVRNRLAKRSPWLLTCLVEPAAEPTNNRAERALRPAVIARKLSCGNRTDRGRVTWEILASLLTTWTQRGHDFLEQLTPRLLLSRAVR